MLYEKFKKIINKVETIGFDDYHQAGTSNKYHELNLVCTSEALDRVYWVSKSFGEFTVSYRQGISDYKQQKQTKRVVCRNQTEVVKELQKVKDEIETKLIKKVS